jgi:hypothetical protein
VNRYGSYFDSHYLPRALVLFASLDRHDPGWSAHVLALDEACERALRGLGRTNLTVTNLAQLEAAEPRLLQVKGQRNRVEYYFTCGPAFLDQVLGGLAAGEGLTYVDADLCFYSPPQPVYAELARASVGLVEHRFSARNQKSLPAGRFNVGWLFFRQDSNGSAALRWWKERCLEWCFDRFEDGKYADQLYLEGLAAQFQGVHSVQHPGVNVAPWNVDGLTLSRGEAPEGLQVSGQPLVVYHVHGVKQLSPRLFRLAGADYGARFWGLLRSRVYRPYLRELEAQAGSAPSAGQLRYGDQALTLRDRLKAVKRAVYNGSYVFRAFGRYW